ncbi:hypothetical protein PENTCL1PPCAC_26211, partial [Pristionchus entomophagus]
HSLCITHPSCANFSLLTLSDWICPRPLRTTTNNHRASIIPMRDMHIRRVSIPLPMDNTIDSTRTNLKSFTWNGNLLHNRMDVAIMDVSMLFSCYSAVAASERCSATPRVSVSTFPAPSDCPPSEEDNLAIS